MSNLQSIRSIMRQQRNELSLGAQRDAARAISSFIQAQAWFQEASKIAFYVAVRGEVDPYLLLKEAHALGKTCYLPALSSSKAGCLEFVAYYPADPFTVNCYGILEPLPDIHAPCVPDILDSLDCILMPLLAFDSAGNRLGSGKGYYDKTLSPLACHSQSVRRTKLIGLAYEFQQVEALQAECWDVPLDGVVVFDSSTDVVCQIPHCIMPPE